MRSASVRSNIWRVYTPRNVEILRTSSSGRVVVCDGDAIPGQVRGLFVHKKCSS